MEKVIRSIAAVGTLAIGFAALGHATGLVDRVGDASGQSLMTPAVAATNQAATVQDEPELTATELAEVVEAANEQVLHPVDPVAAGSARPFNA